MKKYWNTAIYSQLSVEDLIRKANDSISQASGKGRVMEPIIVKNKAITTSWWGQAWCENLEQYADYASRIERGKRYVRAQAVVDLKIAKGKIHARVQGRRKAPYRIEIRISPLKEKNCQEIMKKCASKIESLEVLVRGDFPEELKELFTSEDGLFPNPSEISLQCSCPDWAIMCKHVAAVLYGIGVRLDENPFLFFTLRGIDLNHFIDVTLNNKVEEMLKHANVKSTRILDVDTMHNVFGV